MRNLGVDGQRLFTTRVVRMFAYGSLAVVLALYLTAIGLSELQIGLLLTLALVGDTLLSLWITTMADRVGRKRMLLLGAGLMILAGGVFALTRDPIVLLAAAIVGIISPGGSEVGPFLSIEQASLSQIVASEHRTRIFAWYNLVGSLATASGALVGGLVAQALQRIGWTPVGSYQFIVISYGSLGIVLLLLSAGLSSRIESPPGELAPPTSKLATKFGLRQSHTVIIRLSALFALDAFAGGFVVQSIIALWFYVRFAASPALLGGIFFGTNLLAGVSALYAARLAGRIGLVNTMVFTHLPSNILLILVPLMPTLPLAILVLLLRSSISQMDVPTRQSYTMALVQPDERSAAAGITGVARTTGAALAPVLAMPLLSNPAWLGLPFFIAGSLKIVYDLLLYRGFRVVKPPEEMSR